MHQYFFSVGCNHFTKSINGFFIKPRNIHKIVYHIYLFVYRKRFKGFIFQILRNRCNGITFINRKGNNGFISFVLTHQCNICSVQSGDHRYIPSILLFHDLLGHIGRRCMGDGIMHMQEVKVMVNNHINHGTGQSHFIRRIIK